MTMVLSKGYKQRVALADALIHRPKLLILDEPTNGLDPTQIRQVRELLRTLRSEMTILLSTHILHEVEQTCDRVAFLRQGRLVRELEMPDLAQKHRITAADLGETIHVPDTLAATVRVRKLVQTNRPSQWQIDTVGDLAPLLSWLDSLGLSRVRIEPLGLRSVYDDVHHLVCAHDQNVDRASEVTV